MQRAMRLPLIIKNKDVQPLLLTMEAYSEAFNISATWGYDNKSFNKIENHKATY